MRRISVLAAAGLLCALAVAPAAAQAATITPTAAASATFGTVSTATRLAASASGVDGFQHVAPSTAIEHADTPRALTKAKSPGGPNPAALGDRGGRRAGDRREPEPVQDIGDRGLRRAERPDQRPAFGALTPPDQGLCVGPDHTVKGTPDAVWEVVNEVGEEFSKTGAAIRPAVNLPTLFQDQYSFSDPRCLFDPSTQSFYFTEIGYPTATGPQADGNNTVNDVLVVNSRGAATYQFDSSLGGTCLGDQPKTGFDGNALVISTDEYCGPTESNYEGAIVQVISKSQLAAEAPTVNWAVSSPVSLAGNPVVGLDPAINTGGPVAYLVNSVPFNADGSNNALGRTLGLWTLADTAAVTTGRGVPVLSSKVLASEPYAFPVMAPSTGNGSTSTFGGATITSETALNPDDSRLAGPVNVSPGPGGTLNLWTALDAAVNPTGGTATKDGAAWFEINTGVGRVVNQGYVAAGGGASLLYPAVYATPRGSATMVYTITSPTLNPSAAFSVLGRPGIQVVGAGSGPHLSFSDAPPFNSPRWGDYSWAAPDPESGSIWMATEYIPPPSEWDGFDNWGTFIFAVNR